jgi:hypothetical protein
MVPDRQYQTDWEKTIGLTQIGNLNKMQNIHWEFLYIGRHENYA